MQVHEVLLNLCFRWRSLILVILCLYRIRQSCHRGCKLVLMDIILTNLKLLLCLVAIDLLLLLQWLIYQFNLILIMRLCCLRCLRELMLCELSIL